VDPRKRPLKGVKHALFALAQYAALTLVAAAAGAFSERVLVNEFLGHVGPPSLLVASGVLAFVGPDDERRVMVWEGRLGIVAGLAYVVADALYAHPPYGAFGAADAGEQLHVSFMALVAAVGLLTLLFVRALGRPSALHVVILAAAFALFIGAHHQHGETSAMSHNACALFALLAAAFRVLGRRAEYGVCIIAAAYLFYSGQITFGAWHVDPVAWVSVWTAAGILVAAAYLTAFNPRKS